MTAPVQSYQPTTEHTPTPWKVDDNTILTTVDGISDDIVCVSDGADTPNWDTDAALICEAVNNHAALKARIKELEAALRPILNIIEREWDFKGAHPHRAALIADLRAALQSEKTT